MKFCSCICNAFYKLTCSTLCRSWQRKGQRSRSGQKLSHRRTSARTRSSGCCCLVAAAVAIGEHKFWNHVLGGSSFKVFEGESSCFQCHMLALSEVCINVQSCDTKAAFCWCRVKMASQISVWCFLAVASMYVSQLPFCCTPVGFNLCFDEH